MILNAIYVQKGNDMVYIMESIFDNLKRNIRWPSEPRQWMETQKLLYTGPIDKKMNILEFSYFLWHSKENYPMKTRMNYGLKICVC